MPCHSWFHGHGRAGLAGKLQARDPFALTPADVFDRVIAAGFTPADENSRDRLFRVIGKLDTVDHEGVVCFVSINRDADEIRVQEQRSGAYAPVE